MTIITENDGPLPYAKSMSREDSIYLEEVCQRENYV